MIARGDRLPAFDLHCSLLSLPHAFRTTLETIPAQIPYVSAAPNRMKHWAEVLGDPERTRIGIVWAGSATNKNDHNRSAALADFAALRTSAGSAPPRSVSRASAHFSRARSKLTSG